MSDEANRTESDESEGHALLVVDIAKKQTRKRIRALRKGKGRLMDKVQDMLTELQEKGAINADAQTVVVVVRQKARKLMSW